MMDAGPLAGRYLCPSQPIGRAVMQVQGVDVISVMTHLKVILGIFQSELKCDF